MGQYSTFAYTRDVFIIEEIDSDASKYHSDRYGQLNTSVALVT